MKYAEVNSTTAEIKFYGYIGMWWISAKDFTDTIEEIERKYQNLDIRVHCYGGEVFEGNVMFNTIQRSKLNTTFIIEGVSASMSAIVMLSGKTIKMAENAFVMIHAPSGYTAGDSRDHFSTAKLLKSIELNSAKAFAKRTGKPLKEFEALMDGNDHWLSAQECKDMKLVDEVIDPFDQTSIEKPDAGTPVEKIYGLYAAIAAPNISQQNSSDMTKEMKQSLIDKHGLKNVTSDSSDTAIQAAIDARFAELSNENNSLKTQQTTGVTAQAEAIIAAKEVELKTKFSEEQKTKFKTAATSMGIEAMKGLLDEIKPAANIVEMITPEGSGKKPDDPTAIKGRENWTLQDYAKNDPDALQAMSVAADGSKEKLLFNKLYNAEYKTKLPEA